MRVLMPTILLTCVALMSVPAQAGQKFVLKSVSVDLPVGDRMFPGGSRAEVVNNNCLACHSAGMVTNQPALTRDQWAAEVNKMRTAYRAPIDPADMAAIVDYLAGATASR
jgi:mono/diheme cytochrome c family protein